MQSAPRPSDRIVIVGGGPAGIHLAHLLAQRGHAQVTVLERSDRIGGKSLTVARDGVPHELGTCYFTTTYRRLMDLVAEHHLAEAVEVGPAQRQCVADTPDGRSTTAQWLLRGTTRDAFCADLLRYIDVHRAFVAAGPYDAPHHAHPAAAEVLARPMGAFLADHGLDGLRPIFLLHNTAMGYGYADSVPAYYGLHWMSGDLLRRLHEHLTGARHHVITGMYAQGFQSIWEKLAERSRLRVETGAAVQRVRRLGDGRGCVRVAYDQRGEAREEEFDFLVSATPAREALRWLERPTEQERDLFGGQRHSTLITRLLEVESPHPDDGIVYHPERLVPERRHQVYSFRNAARILTGRPSQGPQTWVSYQYLDDEGPLDAEASEQGVRDSLAAFDARLLRVVESRTWAYFHRFGASDIRRGAPWQVMRSQGENRTWFVGSSVSFESVNAVLHYNHELVDTLL